MPLFSVPVYVSDIDLDFNNIVNHVHNVECVTVSVGFRSKDPYILNQPELSSLNKMIEEHIRIYTRDILCVKTTTEFYIVNSWVYKTDPEGFSIPHIHSNSILSGVVYLNDDYTNSGNIVFEKQNRLTIFTPTIEPELDSFNIFNSSEWCIQPKQKMIVLFPSHLTHKVTKNNTNQSRYSLAFNVFVKGVISHPSEISDLIL